MLSQCLPYLNIYTHSSVAFADYALFPSLADTWTFQSIKFLWGCVGCRDQSKLVRHFLISPKPFHALAVTGLNQRSLAILLHGIAVVRFKERFMTFIPTAQSSHYRSAFPAASRESEEKTGSRCFCLILRPPHPFRGQQCRPCRPQLYHTM